MDIIIDELMDSWKKTIRLILTSGHQLMQIQLIVLTYIMFSSPSHLLEEIGQIAVFHPGSIVHTLLG